MCDNWWMTQSIIRVVWFNSSSGFKLMCSPNHKERVAIKMIALNDVLVVLEDNLDERSVVSLHNRSVKVNATTSGSVGYASHAENTWDLEVVGELQRRVWDNIWHAVDCVSLLAIYLTSRTGQYDGLGCVYHTVMVRPLWVRPRSTCCKVSPESMD